MIAIRVNSKVQSVISEFLDHSSSLHTLDRADSPVLGTLGSFIPPYLLVHFVPSSNAIVGFGMFITNSVLDDFFLHLVMSSAIEAMSKLAWEHQLAYLLAYVGNFGT